MKRILNVIFFVGVLLFGFTSCEIDNYDEPAETLMGSLIDATTGQLLQMEQGTSSMRVKLEELSFSDNPTAQYLAVMRDGRYVHKKLFEGNYRITPTDGPFIPLVIKDSNGNVLTDGSKVVDIKGKTTVDFQLEPFLRIEYIGEPVLADNKTLTVKFKFTKGTNSPHFNIPAFLDCQLFMSNTQYVGNNNYNNTVVGGVLTTYNGLKGDALVGQEIVITSKTLKSGYKYYMRVGARVNDSYKKYNYTDVKVITVP